MKKDIYRIVEVKKSTLTKNTGGIVGFIPEIEWETYYKIEMLVSHFWGFYKYWKYCSLGRSIEHCERIIEFYKTEDTEIVIKET